MNVDVLHDKDIREPLFERDYNTIAQEIEDFRKSRKR